VPAIGGRFSAYVRVDEIEGVVAIGHYRTRTAALAAIVDCRPRPRASDS
jgi:hypothetical protein